MPGGPGRLQGGNPVPDILENIEGRDTEGVGDTPPPSDAPVPAETEAAPAPGDPTAAPSAVEEQFKENIAAPTAVLEGAGLLLEPVLLDEEAIAEGEITRTPDMDVPVPDRITPVQAEAATIQSTAKADVSKIQDDQIAQASAAKVTAAEATAAKLPEAEQAQVTEDILVRDYEVELLKPEELSKNLARLKDESPMVAASVTTEMNLLLDALESGDIPAWAKPAVTQVEKQLNARGMSASTIGRDALFNAIIQSAMPIAQQNAANIQDANKTNFNAKVTALFSDVAAENAARQFNAASINQKNQFMSGLQAQVDTQNAQRKDAISMFNTSQSNDFAKTQATLDTQISATNAEMATQASIVGAQLETQVSLAATAAKNQATFANAQFENAANVAFASEQNANSRFNVAEGNKVTQFNAAQTNAMTQFQESLDNNVRQFNSNQALVIAQSNANWRRQANTANTAIENQVNMTNTMNAFNLSNQALSNLWQAERDEAQWWFQADENAKDRFNRLQANVLANETVAAAAEGSLFANILSGLADLLSADNDIS